MRLWRLVDVQTFLVEHLPAAEAMQDDKEVSLLGQLLKAEGTVAKLILSRVLCRAWKRYRGDNIEIRCQPRL